MMPDWLCGDADSIHGEMKAAAYSGRYEQDDLAEKAMKAKPGEFAGRFGNL
jgi:hypothetical protein